MKARLAVAALAIAGAMSCGGEEAPTAPPTPPPTTAAPQPTPPPAADNGCGLPKANGTGFGCPRLSASFLADMDLAIETVADKHPELVDKSNQYGNGTYYVLNQQGYINAMLKQLKKQGFCAFYDGAEFAIKKSNSFNDQYKAIVSDGHIRRGEQSYKATCKPAWSAIP